MTKQEEQKIMLDILKAELRCKNIDCDRNIIFCSECSNIKFSDEEIADALRYAIECIEQWSRVCEWIDSDSMKDIAEYVHRYGVEYIANCIEKQMSMVKKLSEIEEVIYDYCDTMVYKIIMEKIADILGIELIQIGLEW